MYVIIMIIIAIPKRRLVHTCTKVLHGVLQMAMATGK